MTISSVRWLFALGVGVALSACGDDGGSAGDVGTTDDPTTGPGMMGTSTGDVDPEGTTTDEPPPGVEWEFEPVFGVPNIDDDDENGTNDWLQVIFEGEDDHSTLLIPALPAGHTVSATLSGNLEQTRVWNDGSFVLGSGDGVVQETYDFTPGAEGTTLDIEFGIDYAVAQLTLAHLDDTGAEVESAPVLMMSSPAILNHHMQPTEHVWVVEVQAGFGSNVDMVADYEAVLGDQFTAIAGASYGFDVWIQDEVQLAYGIGAEGQRADTVIDSIRDRPLDPWAEDALEGPGTNIRVWGDPAQATSWDSFGNLENSPPLTNGGVEYPFGRSYYGKQGNLGIHDDMSDFLVAQDIQAPVELDTFWLCVGHVDEFSSFVPDPDSPKGYRFVISDVPSAYALLETLDPTMSLGRYGPDHGFATVGDILDDTALRNLNDALQEDELDPIRETMIAEFGLEESDILYMPSLFETIGGCGGGTAALVPGMVNLIVANLENGESHLFIPDPFFRGNADGQEADPMIQAFSDNLPATLIPHYVDDWDVYHLGLGEVHCGTNMTRTPTDNWWEVGLHLLSGM